MRLNTSRSSSVFSSSKPSTKKISSIFFNIKYSAGSIMKKNSQQSFLGSSPGKFSLSPTVSKKTNLT